MTCKHADECEFGADCRAKKLDECPYGYNIEGADE